MAAMGNGDGTGARSNARCDVEATDGLGPWRSVRCVERAQGHASHSERHEYNCRREGNHQYMLKCVENMSLPVEAGRHDQVKPRSHASMLKMHISIHGNANQEIEDSKIILYNPG